MVDLLFYTRAVKQAALAKADAIFPHSPATASWVWGAVALKTADHSTWARADSDKADLACRAGRSPAAIQWLSLILDLAFRKTYDLPLKLALRVGQTPEDASREGGQRGATSRRRWTARSRLRRPQRLKRTRRARKARWRTTTHCTR